MLGVAAYAADIEFVAGTTVGSMTQVTQNTGDEMTLSGVTITSTYGAFNAGTAYRMGKGSVNTIKCDQNITKIVFECLGKVGTSNYGGDGFAAMDGMTVSEDTKTVTWEGNATSVEFTASGHQVRASKIIVTISGEATSIAAPTFNPAAGTYYEAQNVTLTAEDGATIYYTTNGNEPTTASTVYSAPINVAQNMTIKAIAVKGNLTSSVATAEYVIAQVNTVANIAAYVALGNGAYAAISNPVTVTAALGNNVWVKDATGYMCIYGKVAGNMNYKNGDVIPGGFGGYLKTYNGGPEMTYNGDQDLFGFKAATETAAAEPEVIATTAVTANIWGHLVKIEKATVSDVSGKNFTITDAAGTVAGYNGMNVTLPTDDATYNITGVVTTYTKDDVTTVQVMPVSFEKIVDPTTLPTVANIAALLATTDGKDYKIEGDVTVVAHSGQQLYIMDNSGFARVYGPLEHTYSNGDVLSGVAGNVSMRYGMTQINPIASTFGEAVAGQAVEPTEITIEEVSQSDVHKYMTFPGVTLTAVTKDDGTTDTRNITMTDETGEMLVYLNGFGVNYPESLEGTFDVTGFVVVYKKNDTTDAILEIYPTELKSNSQQQFEKGDVNGDGLVSGADVTALYGYLLDGTQVLGNADVNGDGVISGADVTALYDLLLQ
jgi:hypothetical protein